MSIFEKAEKLITGEKQEAYGDAKEQFDKVALGWSGIIGHEVEAKHVVACMVYLKLIREMHAHKEDNLVDCMGYTGLLEKVQE